VETEAGHNDDGGWVCLGGVWVLGGMGRCLLYLLRDNVRPITGGGKNFKLEERSGPSLEATVRGSFKSPKTLGGRQGLKQK